MFLPYLRQNKFLNFFHKKQISMLLLKQLSVQKSSNQKQEVTQKFETKQDETIFSKILQLQILQ